MKTELAVSAIMLAIIGCSQTGQKPVAVSEQGPPVEFMGLPLLVVEEFDEPTSERWSPTDPEAWTFTMDGDRTVYSLCRKSQYKPAVRSPEGISILKDVCVADFVLDVWVRSLTTNYAHRDMCFVFGHQDATHYYYAHLGLKSDDASNTIHIVNGQPRTSIVKTRTDGTPWTEGYHHVRIARKVEPGTIEVYFDDINTPAMMAEDTTFQWGRIGVGSFDDQGNVDRLILWGKKTASPPQSP